MLSHNCIFFRSYHWCLYFYKYHWCLRKQLVFSGFSLQIELCDGPYHLTLHQEYREQRSQIYTTDNTVSNKDNFFFYFYGFTIFFFRFLVVLAMWYFLFQLIWVYSSLPNRLVAWNKRGGGKDEPFLISLMPGTSVMVGKMSHSLLARCLE